MTTFRHAVVGSLQQTGNHKGNQMTNKEINEKVARKLGWKFLFDPLGHTVVDRVPCFESPNGEIEQSLPDYCTDISAAWEIVEHLKTQSFVVTIEDCYKARVELVHFSVNEKVKAEADTAPMAICLAFLKVEGNRSETRN